MENYLPLMCLGLIGFTFYNRLLNEVLRVKKKLDEIEKMLEDENDL